MRLVKGKRMTHNAKISALLLAAFVAVLMVVAAPTLAFTRFVAKSKATVDGKALTPQKFKSSFGVVECAGFSGVEEGAEKEDSETGVSTVKYEKCFFIPKEGEGKEEMKVSEGSIGASDKSDGSETDKQTNMESTNCKLVVGSGDKQEKSVEFEDSKEHPGNLLAKANTKGVKYTGEGSRCKGSGENGEFETTAEATDPTGTIGVTGGDFVTETKGSVKDKNLEAQLFKTKFGVVECAVESSKGLVTAEKTESNAQAIKFEKCKAFGLEAKLSEAKDLFKANGGLETQNALLVEVSGCKVEIPTGLKFEKALTYENNGGNLKAKLAAELVTFKGKGALCEGEGTNGVYTGAEEIEGNKPPEKINVE